MADAALTLWMAGATRGFADEPDGGHRPGAVLVHDGVVDATGEAPAMRRRWSGEAAVVERPGELLLPGMVNAHAHLELTDVGPRSYGGGFTDWVKQVRSLAPADDASAAAAARRGAAMSLASGVEAVGDIVRSREVVRSWNGTRLAGTGYLELFGLGPPHDAAALTTVSEIQHRTGDARLGLQPHAPYSAGPALYHAAAGAGRPLCTHLAETPEELRFVRNGDGPFRDLLRQMGKWSDAFATHYGRGLTPVQWLAPHLRRAPWLLAHCNYVTDGDIALLAETRASVAYCPIASDYFGHRDHRYRDLLAAGVNVCLGTDSIVCQPRDEPQPLGLVAPMRHLFRRDGTDPGLLLRMATTHGRRALGLDDPARSLVALRFDADDPADALEQALRRDDPAVALKVHSAAGT